jgi:PAS domain S-box-containing protein
MSAEQLFTETDPLGSRVRTAYAVAGDAFEAKTAQWQAILTGLPDGLMVVDSNFRLIEWNERFPEFVGVSAAMLHAGMALEDILRAQASGGEFGPVDVEQEVRRRMSLFESGANVGTIERKRPNGQTLELRRNLLPRGGFVTLYTDITARRRAEEQLRHSTERRRRADERQRAERRQRLAVEAANVDLSSLSRLLAQARDQADQASQAKSRFLAGMSHELRTPLNAVLGYAQLLHMEGGLNAKQGARVDAMLGAGKHLLQIITCVLDLSEIEAEHVELQAVEFDVQSVAEASLDLIRPTAEAKGLALGFVMVPGTRRELIADPTRLRQVLLNLLGNAAKFTSHGAVELRLRPAACGSMLRIEVADTGAGIPADQRQRLFNDFERLDNEATRTAEGSGLGLALSSRLATLMGGRLGHDDNPGGGSVFWLELPLSSSATSHPDFAHVSAGRDAQPPPSPTRPLHVLVVDDVLMNRDIGEAFLRTAGHEVTCAEGGAESL